MSAAREIAEYYANAVKNRGRPYNETFIDPATKEPVRNGVTIPIDLLNKLVKQYKL